MAPDGYTRIRPEYPEIVIFPIHNTHFPLPQTNRTKEWWRGASVKRIESKKRKK